MILHCFSAPHRVGDAAERGWYCSFAGNATYPSAKELLFAAAKVPEDRILVETDAPYLAPQPMRGKRNQPAFVVETARGDRRRARRLLRGAGAHGRGQRPGAVRLVAAWSGSGRTSSPTPTCSTRSSATPSSAPGDVVLEVGAGEGVLSERLAAAAAHLHTVEIDRGLEPALAPVAALPNVELHWGDAMKLDLAALDPAPTRDGRQPALLGGDAADPADDRGAALAAALDGDGAAGDRRPAARRAGQPHLRVAERGRPARLRGRAGAGGRPGRLQAAAAGRLGDPAPAPHRPGRRRRDAEADPRRLRPPPQVPGALARARRGRAASAPARAALAELGLPEDARAEALAPEQFAALSAKLRG